MRMGGFGGKVGGNGKGLLTYVGLMKMYSFELGFEWCILCLHDSNAAHDFLEISEDSESQTGLCFSKLPQDLGEVMEREDLGSCDRKYSIILIFRVKNLAFNLPQGAMLVNASKC